MFAPFKSSCDLASVNLARILIRQPKNKMMTEQIPLVEDNNLLGRIQVKIIESVAEADGG